MRCATSVVIQVLDVYLGINFNSNPIRFVGPVGGKDYYLRPRSDVYEMGTVGVSF